MTVSPKTTTWRCAGRPPHEPPCDATITSEAAAKRHTQTGHSVHSGTNPEALARVVEAAGGAS